MVPKHGVPAASDGLSVREVIRLEWYRPLDRPKVRRLVFAVSPTRQAGQRPIRVSLLELKGLRLALSLADQLRAPRFSTPYRIPCGLFLEASLRLHCLTGFEVPFASMGIVVEGGRLVAPVGPDRTDMLTGQVPLPLGAGHRQGRLVCLATFRG